MSFAISRTFYVTGLSSPAFSAKKAAAKTASPSGAAKKPGAAASKTVVKKAPAAKAAQPAAAKKAVAAKRPVKVAEATKLSPRYQFYVDGSMLVPADANLQAWFKSPEISCLPGRKLVVDLPKSRSSSDSSVGTRVMLHGDVLTSYSSPSRKISDADFFRDLLSAHTRQQNLVTGTGGDGNGEAPSRSRRRAAPVRDELDLERRDHGSRLGDPTRVDLDLIVDPRSLPAT